MQNRIYQIAVSLCVVCAVSALAYAQSKAAALTKIKAEFVSAQRDFDKAETKLKAARTSYEKAIESAQGSTPAAVIAGHEKTLSAAPRMRVQVVSALYGVEGKVTDVTAKVRAHLQRTGVVSANAQALRLGDPAFGMTKLMVLDLRLNGAAVKIKLPENGEIAF